jgi:hypothetical protein
MSTDERDISLRLRKTLGISYHEHNALEDYILRQSKDANKQFYKLALRQTLADKKITRDEQAILEKLKKHLNIIDDIN